MNDNAPSIHHRMLLSEVDSSESGTRRKRPGTRSEPIFIEDTPDADSSDSDEFEDVDLDIPGSEEFEEVDLTSSRVEPVENETLVIQIRKEEQPKKQKNLISLEERRRRVLLHKMYLVLMATHGSLRNSWCNNKELQKLLKASCITSQIMQLLQSDDDVLDQVKSRRLLDGLKKLMTIYLAKFRMTSQGLIRKDWHELGLPQRSDIVSKKTFKKLVSNLRGSRDLGAQGFVILLRGLGLNARLVMSMQPPDFTKITVDKNMGAESNKKRRILPAALQDSEYPTFWVEVWNKFQHQWVSIDPVMKKIIEVCPKRKKSSFEPASTDERNQLTYVLAYDKYGRVRDVTRRYSYQYNARTIRKRIEFRSSDDKLWYQKILRGCDQKKSNNLPDIYEQKEFHDRDLAEGMPNNIQAFRNHPLYALESQLRQDEIIHPKDNSTQCGTFRSKTTSRVITVYKRSSVHRLRSAKAWAMRGRQLKMGAIPMKQKDEDGRLYAEFQTQLYLAPPVENGIVPKNQYGNIDVYKDTMLPENSVLLESSEQCLMKLLQQAARLLDIDYARAIVAFDFKGRKLKNKPTAKEGGIVIAKEYEEAARLAVDYLIEQEEDAKRLSSETNALNNWKYFLLKLRLEDRLNKSHGVIDESGEIDDDVIEGGGFIVDDEEEPEVAQDDNVFAGSGGFIAGDAEETERSTRNPEPTYYDSGDQDSLSEAEVGSESDMEFDYESE
ncbi:DNA repair protein RAD4 [Candida viswanathii]|uniref:DNA repair protein RAD4 n=1 Tax=Candida viswanathii TaxID=5486 RepID=A0A367XV86_9ASCO|nr:DNA repair protein RAD4 [Candida viswanathii]